MVLHGSLIVFTLQVPSELEELSCFGPILMASAYQVVKVVYELGLSAGSAAL